MLYVAAGRFDDAIDILAQGGQGRSFVALVAGRRGFRALFPARIRSGRSIAASGL